ncbi:MAG: MFS transporter [Chloroflexi bacterium]|nr:MFS transporter [Chloroflexota bacterium]
MTPKAPRPRLLAWLAQRVPYPELLPLYLAVFVDVLGYSVLIPFLPFFAQQYHATPVQIGLLLSANALFGLFSGPVWGSLSDRYGRKPFLLLSQAGTLLGFVILLFARSLPMLFLSRIVDGVFGGQFPIAKAIIGDVSRPEDRSKEMSNIGVAHVLSSLLGPGIGGLLSRGGVGAPALLAAGLTVITLLLTALFVRESRPGGQDAAVRAAGGGRPARTRPTALLHNADARLLLVQWLFHTLSFSMFMSCISLFANLVLGLDAQQMGLMLTLAGLVRVFVRFAVFVPLLRRLGERNTSRLGLGLFVIAYAVVGFVTGQWQFAAVLCMSSLAASCTRGPLTGFLSRAVRPSEQGVAMGASVSLDNLAQVVGPIVGGAILGAWPAWVYGALASMLAVVAFVLAYKSLALTLDQARGQGAPLQAEMDGTE